MNLRFILTPFLGLLFFTLHLSAQKDSAHFEKKLIISIDTTVIFDLSTFRDTTTVILTEQEYYESAEVLPCLEDCRNESESNKEICFMNKIRLLLKTDIDYEKQLNSISGDVFVKFELLINENNYVTSVKILSSSGNKSINLYVEKALHKLDNQWLSGTIDGLPVGVQQTFVLKLK
ncbi:MAG: hypothetical protein ABI851_08715 [Saprospiraceae bacterium]